ncbi:MAG: hypothetical protein ACE144_12805 [Thermodesulfobacteriota bacterium]
MTQYNYPAPIAPVYKEPKSVKDCLPQARMIVKKEHGRMAMGPVIRGDRILIITLPDQNEYVKEAIVTACKEAGAAEVKFILPSELTGKKEKKFSVEEGWEEAKMLEEGIASGSPETADLASGMNVAKPLYDYLEKHQEYTKVFWDLGARPQKVHVLGKYGGKFKANWLFNNWEEFLSRAWIFPDELSVEIEKRIIDMLGKAQLVRITDPEGTFLEFPLTVEEAKRWQMGAWLRGHLYMDPLMGTVIEGERVPHSEEVPPVFRNLNGVLAGTSNHRGFFPRIELHFEKGRLVEVKKGGRYGELIGEMMERYKKVHWPGYPEKGFFWFCDCALCTIVKSFRRTSDMFDSRWGFPNISERNRAGVFHLGIGSRRHRSEHLEVARKNKIPLGHIHVHNYFVTYEIKLHGSENWYKIVDKGWLTAMSDPDIRCLATKYGDPDKLLSYDWVPPIPGINCEGEYLKDYAPNPVAYLKKRLAKNQPI